MSYPLSQRCMEYASRRAYATRKQWKRDVLVVRNVQVGWPTLQLISFHHLHT